MTLKQKVFKGLIWSAIESWGSRVVTFAVFFVLARLLEPESFGLIALASVFTAFVQLFLDQGIGKAIVQRENLEPEHLDSAFWMNVGMGCSLTFLSFISANWFASIFDQPELAAVIRVLSFGFLVTSLSSVQEAIFLRNMAFKVLSTRALIATLVSGLIGVSMAYRGFGVWSLVSQQLSNGLVRLVILWMSSHWRPNFNFSMKHFRDLFEFGINMLGINVLVFIDCRSDDFLIGYFLGPTALGYYTVAYRLLLVVSDLLGSILAKVSLPAFSKLQTDPEKMRRGFYKASQVIALIVFPSFLTLSILSPEVILSMYGEKWAPSIPVMQVLSFAGILQSINFLNTNLILSTGKSKWQLGISTVNSLLNAVGFLIAAQWGIVAVALVYTIRGYVMFPPSLYIIKKLTNISIKSYIQSLSKGLVVSLTVCVTLLSVRCLSLPYGEFTKLLVYVASSTLAYLISLLILYPNILKRKFL